MIKLGGCVMIKIKSFLIFLFCFVFLVSSLAFADEMCLLMSKIIRKRAYETFKYKITLPPTADTSCGIVEGSFFSGKVCFNPIQVTLKEARLPVTLKKQKEIKKRQGGATQNFEVVQGLSKDETIDETYYLLTRAAELIIQCINRIDENVFNVQGGKFGAFAIAFDSLLQELNSNESFARTFFTKMKSLKTSLKQKEVRISDFREFVENDVVNVVLKRQEINKVDVKCVEGIETCCSVKGKNSELDICIQSSFPQSGKIDSKLTINRVTLKTLKNPRISSETWEGLLYAIHAFVSFPLSFELTKMYFEGLGLSVNSIVNFRGEFERLQVQLLSEIFDTFLDDVKSNPALLKKLISLNI